MHLNSILVVIYNKISFHKYFLRLKNYLKSMYVKKFDISNQYIFLLF